MFIEKRAIPLNRPVDKTYVYMNKSSTSQFSKDLKYYI